MLSYPPPTVPSSGHARQIPNPCAAEERREGRLFPVPIAHQLSVTFFLVSHGDLWLWPHGPGPVGPAGSAPCPVEDMKDALGSLFLNCDLCDPTYLFLVTKSPQRMGASLIIFISVWNDEFWTCCLLWFWTMLCSWPILIRAKNKKAPLMSCVIL